MFLIGLMLDRRPPTARLAVLAKCLAGALAFACAPPAQAQRTVATDASAQKYARLLPVRIDGHASLTWDGDFGVGGRVDVPVLSGGKLYGTRDELSISVGADVIFVAFEGTSPRDVWPTAVVQWSIGVSDRFAFYPEFGVVGHIERDGWSGAFPNIGFGGRYALWRSVSITGRLGYPMAISLGVSF